MPRKPSFSFLKTSSGWKVEIPSTLSGSGKRERAFFKTRDKARDYAQELETKYKESGSNSLAIKPSLAEAAIRAEEILEPTGASLIQAAQEFRRQWDAKNSSQLFGNAVTTYLGSRADLRDVTLTSYKYTLEKVCSPFLPRTMSDITTTEIGELILAKAPTAARMHLANFRAFWNWASKPPRSWCLKEVADGLERPRKSDDQDIKILSPDEVAALLSAAEAESHGAAAAYAIAVFGGVRMGELEKLTWGDVKQDVIDIGAAIAKKHARRLVPIGATLRTWLDSHRNDEEGDTLIVPASWTEVSKAVRRRAGWNVVARRLKKPPVPTRETWPANACRHTCASVQVAIGTSLDQLVFAFGHSGGHDLLRKHYVSRLTRKDAIKILSVGPNGENLTTLNVA